MIRQLRARKAAAAFWSIFAVAASAILTPAWARASCDPKQECCAGQYTVAPRLVQLTAMAANRRFKEETFIARSIRASRILPLIIAESGGDPTCVTDMQGTSARRPFEWGRPGANTSKWETTEVRRSLSRPRPMDYNSETNFGMMQQSSNVLTTDSSGGTRRIFTEYRDLMRTDPEAALEKCASRDFYSVRVPPKEFFGSAATCEIEKTGKCFGKVMMLCPALNLELGLQKLKTRPGYFQNHRKRPLCEAHFRKIFKKIEAESSEESEPRRPAPTKGAAPGGSSQAD